MKFTVRPATPHDVPAILQFIRELAEFEKLLHEVVGTEEQLRTHLFGAKPVAEVLIAEGQDDAGALATVGFALFFVSFSTFRTQPGIYLEDLYVSPKYRSFGLGRILLSHLAKLTVERGYGRLEWSVLDWNTRAWDFYASLGAVPKSEWTGHRLDGDALEKLASAASFPSSR